MEDLYPIPRSLPIIHLNNVVMYPHLMLPLIVSEDNLKKVVDNALSNDKLLGFFLSKRVKANGEVDVFKVGTAVSIVRMIRNPDGSISLLLQGISRIKVDKITQHHPFMIVECQEIKESTEDNEKLRATRKITTELLEQVIFDSLEVNKEIIFGLKNIKQHSRVADIIAGNLSFAPEVKQDILQTFPLQKRFEKLNHHLAQLIKQIKIESTIRDNVHLEIEEDQKKYYLREQLEAIKKELGEYDEIDAEIQNWMKKINSAGLPEYVKEAAKDEVKKISMMHPSSSEFSVTRNYLDWIINLPWQITTDDRLDLHKIETILSDDHYGLEKAKDRIIEFIAVKKLLETPAINTRKTSKSLAEFITGVEAIFDTDTSSKKEKHPYIKEKPHRHKSPILCFVGPPGVGKTSLGQSIARAMNRKFIRMSLGGIHDEAEIRGHRRTYIGSMPGKVLSELKRCGSANPIFMLDEIDKVGKDFRGDPASALLEVLDPEQNHTFMDNYIQLPFDLSKCFFITTANSLETIPPALKDRMEIINFHSYIEEEKIQIARKYLIPKELQNNGISKKHIEIKDSAIKEVIRYYVREAGVRDLQRNIAKIMRKVARKVAETPPVEAMSSSPSPSSKDSVKGVSTKKAIVTDQNVKDYLGCRKYTHELSGRQPEIGITTGLAWTSFGGEILFCEANKMRGKGKIVLTGSLGDVMQESAKLALSYIKANADKYEIPSELFETHDIHIHLPAGAVPKDGPSAGVTLTTSLLSLFTQKKVRHDIAMTGEITLYGRVLPVGGVREKVLAAKRAGITLVLLPDENIDSFEEIAEEIRADINVKYVKHIDDVLKEVFC